MTLDWSVTWAPSNVSWTCLTLKRDSDSACASLSWKRLLAIWLDRYAPTIANDVTASSNVVRTVRNSNDRRHRLNKERQTKRSPVLFAARQWRRVAKPEGPGSIPPAVSRSAPGTGPGKVLASRAD